MSTSTYSGTASGGQQLAAFRRKPAREWLDAVALVETDECIPFPFKRNALGYGIFVKSTGRLNRKRRRAHNYVCEVAHGPAPSGKHIAAHSCDNPPCCNKRHLRWATRAENSGDMVLRGRAAKPAAKLTPDQVRAIRSQVAHGNSQKSVAARFGMSRATVCEIVSRKLWKDVE